MNSNTPFYEFSAKNPEMSEYFNTLPKNVQETIMQSHGSVQTLDELKGIVEGLMGQN